MANAHFFVLFLSSVFVRFVRIHIGVVVFFLGHFTRLNIPFYLVDFSP